MNLGLAGYSLRRRFKNGELKLLDFPQQAKKEFGINAIELNQPFFESLDNGYLKELKVRVKEEGMQIVHISVDNEGDLAAIDEDVRREAVENHKKWIYIAKALNCPTFRANTGGCQGITDKTIMMCIKSFNELCQEAAKEGITVLIENHGGISADPDAIGRIVNEVGKNIGTCPDFGNFPDGIRYEGLKKISKYAKRVHAKFYEFDEKGEDIKIDASRAIGIFKDIGFKEWILIEFVGKGNDHEGVLKSIELCQRYISS